MTSHQRPGGHGGHTGPGGPLGPGGPTSMINHVSIGKFYVSFIKRKCEIYSCKGNYATILK